MCVTRNFHNLTLENIFWSWACLILLWVLFLHNGDNNNTSQSRSSTVPCCHFASRSVWRLGSAASEKLVIWVRECLHSGGWLYILWGQEQLWTSALKAETVLGHPVVVFSLKRNHKMGFDVSERALVIWPTNSSHCDRSFMWQISVEHL